MTHLRDEIRKLTEEQSEKMWETCTFDFPDEFQEGLESAILAGIKLVLEREPSQEMLIAGALHSSASVRYRAMTAELLKEME